MERTEHQIILGRLIELGEIDKSQQNQAISRVSSWREMERFLVEGCKVDPWLIAKLRAENSGWMYAEWRMNPDRIALMQEFSKSNISTYICVPVDYEGGVLSVAFAEDPTFEMRNTLKQSFPSARELNLYCVPHTFIEECLSELSWDDANIQTHLGALGRWADGDFSESAASTQFILERIFYDAHVQRASDIHFVPEDTTLRVLFRIDGILKPYREIDLKYWGYVSARIKVLASMNTAESRRPQSGRFTQHIKGKEIDIRVASHPTIKGEALVLRLLDKHKMVVSIDALGFCDQSLHMLKRIYTQPQGLVLLTGPTGSGKTTTLYSILHQLNQGKTNIMTLEDPVEYDLAGVRQTSIQKNVMSFQEGIRAILRQDPDVILIGEIRDEETAKMAFRAAQTGHLVFSTLHTNNVWGVFPRLMDLGVSFETIKQSVVGVVAQRLIRKRCECLESPTCNQCDGEGLYGRTVLAEMLEVTPEVRSHIVSDSLGNVSEELQRTSYISMQSAAQSVLQRNLTLRSEVQRYGVDS